MKREKLKSKREDEGLSIGIRLYLASTHQHTVQQADCSWEGRLAGKASTSLAAKSDAITINDQTYGSKGAFLTGAGFPS